MKNVNRTRTRRTASVAAVTIGLIGAGVALASWTSTGTGTGAAQAGNAQDLTLSGASVSGLYPTQVTSQSVTVTNPNTYPVTLTSLTLNSVTSSNPGCDVATDIADIHGGAGTTANVLDLSSSPNKRVAASGSQSFTFPLKVENSLDNACQGASFTLTYQADGASSE